MKHEVIGWEHTWFENDTDGSRRQIVVVDFRDWKSFFAETLARRVQRNVIQVVEHFMSKSLVYGTSIEFKLSVGGEKYEPVLGDEEL